MFFNRNLMLMPELFRRDLGDWLDNVVEGTTNRTRGFPALNVWEESDNLFVEAELPGMQPADIEILVTGGDQLTLKGERKAVEVEKAAWHRQERGFGKFVRTLQLPYQVDPEKVEAKFENGVLNIRLSKHEAAKARKITVKGE